MNEWIYLRQTTQIHITKQKNKISPYSYTNVEKSLRNSLNIRPAKEFGRRAQATGAGRRGGEGWITQNHIYTSIVADINTKFCTPAWCINNFSIRKYHSNYHVTSAFFTGHRKCEDFSENWHHLDLNCPHHLSVFNWVFNRNKWASL